MKRVKNEPTDDLFAAVGQNATGVPLKLIASPLVQETEPWLAGQVKTFGSMLAAERAVEYVAILRALADFRRHHEPEPLHEDVSRVVCGEAGDAFMELTFKSDIRQLKEWGLVTERIEKERLRGYRDNRRTKFRYRMSDEAAAFVDWLADRRDRALNDAQGDITGNLLDLQCSLLHELRRKLRAAARVDYDLAGDILYRVEQMRVYVEATARTLQELNLRLLAFGAESFTAAEAKPIIDELAVFLERFGRRFGALREDILRDLEELRRPNWAVRWTACEACLQAETVKFRHIASVRIPNAPALLADAASFYGPEGALVDLMQRIVDSARKVWGKLNAKLRELERRNHRLEDLGLRLVELANKADDFVPYGWMRRLLETGAMRGDAQIRPGGEKSHHPLPKASARVRTKKTVTWITPRTVGEKANVASIAQVRGERLKAWLTARGLYPDAGTTRLSALQPAGFEDFPQVVQLIEYLRLGAGEKGRRHLGLAGQGLAESATASTEDYALTFDDLEMRKSQS